MPDHEHPYTKKCKPCPHCGGKARAMWVMRMHAVQVSCDDCPAHMMVCDGDTVKAWNRRVT